MENDLTRALGLGDIPAFEFESITKRVLEDNLVYSRVLYDLVAQHAPRIIANLHPLELKALRVRIGHPVRENPVVKWMLKEFIKNGELYLAAECPACRQSCAWTKPTCGPDIVKTNAAGEVTERFSPPLYRDQVTKYLSEIVWTHCGVASRPPGDLYIVLEQNWMHTAQERPTQPARRAED